MESISTRTCTKCGEAKPQTAEFYSPCKRSAGGLRRTCRACRNATYREWRRQNPDRVQAYKRTDRENNGERIRARGREYYWKNRDALLATARRYYQANKAAYVERARLWALRNPEKAREHARNANRRNNHARNAITRRYRARKRNAEGAHTGEEFSAKVEAYGGRCHWCGQRIKGTPHADHLIALAKGGTNDIGNIVPSCADCNYTKRDKMPWEFMEGRLL